MAVQRDEAELIQSAQEGDCHAFGLLAEKYRDSLINVAFGFLREKEDALDVAQETLLKAFRKIDGFKRESSLYTWLYRILINLCKDRLRYRKRKKEIYIEDLGEEGAVFEFPDSGPSPRRLAEKRERERCVQDAIATLPEKQRQALILRESGGLSYKEIARILGCQEGTVMSRLFHARKMLALKLESITGDLLE